MRTTSMLRYLFLPMTAVFGLGHICMPAYAMEPLGSDELSEVVAREGISLGLELQINADANGTPISTCGSETDFSEIECRLALKFNNRDADGGEWLVFKNYYGLLRAPSIFLDAGRTPVSATEYEDLGRFRDENGAPLLSTPHDIPALAFTFPEPIELLLNIGGMNVEYGATAYLDNLNNPFMGVRVGNVAGGPAVIQAEGTMYWYGF